MVGAVGRPVAAALAVLLVLCGTSGVAAAVALPDAAPATTGDRPRPGASDPAIGGWSSPVAAATGGASSPVGAADRPTLARGPGAEAAPTGVPSGARATSTPLEPQVAGVPPEPRVTGAPPTDATVTRIRLQADGTAVWTVEIRTLLTNDTDLAAYEAFQVRFRNDTERYLGSFRDRMTRLVERAANVTGREMRARNFTAETSIDRAPRRWGVVTYRFRWSGFARVGDEGLAVGDVFQSGYYLAESDSLVIEAPQGYVVDGAVPEPTASGDLTVRWSGPIDFGDGRPSVRVSLPSTPTPAPTGTPTEDDGAGGDGAGGGETGGDGGSGSGGLPILPAVVLGVVLLVGGVGAYVVVGRTRGPGGQGGSDGTAVADGEGPAAGVDGAAGAGTAGAAADAGTGESETGDTDGPAPVPDEELLTDEERVVGLLERNGGRMRQADIADELDWSAPKTSRVLSSMADDGEIQKLRLGNENVIDLPEE